MLEALITAAIVKGRGVTPEAVLQAIGQMSAAERASVMDALGGVRALVASAVSGSAVILAPQAGTRYIVGQTDTLSSLIINAPPANGEWGLVIYTGSTAPDCYFPAGMIWPDDGVPPAIEANKRYDIHVRDGLVEWIDHPWGLPAEYQQVEWIGSDGNQYIKITDPVNLYTESWSAEITYSSEEVKSGVSIMLGVGSKTGGWIGYSAGMAAGLDLAVSTPRTYRCSWANRVRTVSADGTSSDANVASGHNTDGSWWIWGAPIDTGGTWASYKAAAKVYGVLPISKGADLQHYLVPCYNRSSGVIGMYDLVTGTFLINAGSGIFTKGADVV